MLAQLLHRFRHDHDVLDIITLMWDQNTNGQTTASVNEVTAALRLLIARISRLFMIIDGVDECHDYSDFFDHLEEIRGFSSLLSLAMFSRPTLPIPCALTPNISQLHLTVPMNFASLKTFLQPRIRDLCRDGVIESTQALDDLVDLVATRANGMFLWARLLVDYLRSPNLTKRQRREALNNLTRLQGLDSMYQEILKSLEQNSWQPAYVNIVRAFQFVAYARRPLHVDELKIAVTIPLTRALDEDDDIGNFEKSLPQMSGALIELDNERRARFVHTSVMEYLTDDSRQNKLLDTVSRLVQEKNLAQRSCASCCLSYLLYTIPPGPLSGEPRVIAERAVLRNRYPFLEYAAEAWSHHALEYFEKLPERLSTECEHFIQLVSEFLSAKRAVTVWIETCWMLGQLPRVFPEQQSSKGKQWACPQVVSSQTTQLLNTTADRLLQLSSELETLAVNWQDVLLESPYEIWEPSISAFHKSSIWETIPGVKIIAKCKDTGADAGKSICLKSQVADDGKRLGILRLSATM